MSVNVVYMQKDVEATEPVANSPLSEFLWDVQDIPTSELPTEIAKASESRAWNTLRLGALL